MNKKILIIDDDEIDRKLIIESLSSDNFQYQYEFIESNNARSGLHYYLNAKPDCTILDYNLGGGDDGLDILKSFQDQGSLNSPIIFVTSNGGEDILKKALKRGAFMYFDKSDLGKRFFSKAVEVSIYQHEQKQGF